MTFPFSVAAPRFYPAGDDSSVHLREIEAYAVFRNSDLGWIQTIGCKLHYPDVLREYWCASR